MSFPMDTALALLEKEVADYQVPVVDLIAAQSKNPLKILIATILSARTKDEVTAEASRRLFAQAETLEALAELSREELEKLIYPVGFFRNKAKYLSELPLALQENFSGQVPDTVEELIKLPGVGRKTANLVVAIGFQKPAICVDTHVHRIMNIWGYVNTDTPLKTEMDLREKLPLEYWQRINFLLVAFGQGTCKPRSPHCDRCVLAEICPQIGVTPRRPPQKKEQESGGVNKAGTDTRGGKERLLVSWNVNGVRAIQKKGFLDILHTFDADVFALQEIKAMPEQLDQELKEVPGYYAYWYPAEKKGYSGTAIYSKEEPLRVIQGLGNAEHDTEGRVLTLEFADYYLVNIYFPNAQPKLKRLSYKMAFNAVVLAHLEELRRQKSVVLCGDLNVAHKSIDLARPKNNEKNPGYSPEERAWMDSLLAAGYVDTFRMFCTEPDYYTWWSYRQNARANNVGWRIDYFVVDEGSRERVMAAQIHDDIMGSDHCPVSIRFA